MFFRNFIMSQLYSCSIGTIYRSSLQVSLGRDIPQFGTRLEWEIELDNNPVQTWSFVGHKTTSLSHVGDITK